MPSCGPSPNSDVESLERRCLGHDGDVGNRQRSSPAGRRNSISIGHRGPSDPDLGDHRAGAGSLAGDHPQFLNLNLSRLLFGRAFTSVTVVRSSTLFAADPDAPAVFANGLTEVHEINIAGCVFYPGQPVVTRANNRTLRYGAGERVRNGDRWTVNAGTRDELYLTNLVTGDRLALPAEYIAAGNLGVNYASTIHRAQGATVDEAHVIVNDRTNNRQLYVAATRGRRANHIHTTPPAFDPDQHGPDFGREDWTPRDAVAAALNEQPDATSAIARRRQLRELVNDTREQSRREQVNQGDRPYPTGNSSDRAAATAERLRHFRIKRNGQSLGR